MSTPPYGISTRGWRGYNNLLEYLICYRFMLVPCLSLACTTACSLACSLTCSLSLSPSLSPNLSPNLCPAIIFGTLHARYHARSPRMIIFLSNNLLIFSLIILLILFYSSAAKRYFLLVLVPSYSTSGISFKSTLVRAALNPIASAISFVFDNPF